MWYKILPNLPEIKKLQNDFGAFLGTFPKIRTGVAIFGDRGRNVANFSSGWILERFSIRKMQKMLLFVDFLPIFDPVFHRILD